MAGNSQQKLVIAVSSRALFDLEESNRVFEEQGAEAYMDHQMEREQDVLAPGVAFGLVSKLLALNGTAPVKKEAAGKGGAEALLLENQHPPSPRVEVILISRNNADAGVRILNSLDHHGLPVSRAAFTTGRPPYHYARAFGAHLFLSANGADVRGALEAGLAAGTIQPALRREGPAEEIRIAFDGDAVLFSDASERIYKKEGLEAFRRHEQDHAATPLEKGPFAGFLDALHRIQKAHAEAGGPIRTALITARGGAAAKRVIHTLRGWGIRIDESVFLDGADKGPFLEAFGADIFSDDQTQHVESAGRYVNAAHVASGVANK